MGTVQKVIRCSVCGHEMLIPAGFEKQPGKCRICGATVNVGAEAHVGVVDDRVQAFKAEVAVKAKEAQAAARVRIIVKAIAVGALTAAACGILMAVFLYFRGQLGRKSTIGGFVASADTGLLLGFVLGTSWVLIKGLQLGPVWGVAVTGTLSTVVGLLIYLLEWAFIAPPDQSVIEMAIVALLGGCVVGFVLGEKVGSRD